MDAANRCSNLPPGWIMKASRRCPTASYYFNTETGKSTWIHPKLLEWESQNAPKEENKKKKKKKEKVQEPAFTLKKDKESPEVKTPSSKIKKQDDTDKSLGKSSDSAAEEEVNLKNRSPVKFAFKSKEKAKAPTSKNSASSASFDIKQIGSHLSFLKGKQKGVQKKKDADGEVQSPRVDSSSSLGLKLISQSYKNENEESKEEAPPEDIVNRKKLTGKRRGKKKKDTGQDLIERIIREINEESEHVKKKETALEEKTKKVVESSSHQPSAKEILPKVKKNIPQKLSGNSLTYRNFELERSQSPHINAIYVDEVTDMEIDEQEIITEIANFRGSVSHSKLPDNQCLPTSSVSNRTEAVHFVVDTNVLIQDVTLLETLKVNRIRGRETVIVIPYVALQEMDGLKKKESIGKACQTAIRWCHKHFEDSDPRVQGQSYNNYLSTLAQNQTASGDDLIRDCCLQLQKEGLDVCLLSNDVNLCNKAFMANISAVGIKKLRSQLALDRAKNGPTSSSVKRELPEDEDCPMKQVKELRDTVPTRYQMDTLSTPVRLSNYGCSTTDRNMRDTSTTVSQDETSQPKKRRTRKNSTLSYEEKQLLAEITASLEQTLSSILKTIMKETYEEHWLSIVKHKPPWSMNELFSCWDKHWIAVMIDKFPRNLKELLEEVRQALLDCKRENCSVSILFDKVKLLYRFFEGKYHKHIKPIHRTPQQIVDDDTSKQTPSTTSPSTPTPATTPPSTPTPSTPASSAFDMGAELNTNQPLPSSVDNVKNMIYHVGVHITYFVALVLDAYNVTHDLPKLRTDRQMNQEEAYVSGVNLHKVTMDLGNAIVRCVSERSQQTLVEMCQLLVSFWSEAREPCPNLPFTDADLAMLVGCQEGQQYLASVLTDLEHLINLLLPVIKVPS